MRISLVSLITFKPWSRRPPQTPQPVLEMLARYYQNDNCILANTYGFNTTNWLSADAF